MNAPFPSGLKMQIRQRLEILPFGLGRELLRGHFLLKYLRWRVSGYGKTRRARREANRILATLRNGHTRKALVVYDNLASPPTYGDYFFVLMLARYFSSQNIAVSFVIVDGEYRDDWSALSTAERSTLVEAYIEIARALLPPEFATVETLAWQQLKGQLEATDVEVPFRDSVLNRQHVYGDALNTLNWLCADVDSHFLDRFLLSYEELAPKVAIRRPDRPYVTWNCRYSTKWGFERNADHEEFLEIHARLQALYPDHDIMVVSDAEGCRQFRELARRHERRCLFSKDYSATLLGDGALILGSRYFYMLRGGGIAVFPMFSRVPHERITSTSSEVPWCRGRATPWASADQIYKHPELARVVLPTLQIRGAEMPDGGRNAGPATT